MEATHYRGLPMNNIAPTYIRTDLARDRVKDPALLARLIESGALATRIINGQRVIHHQALEAIDLTARPWRPPMPTPSEAFCSFDEIAKELGCSKQRVQQIERQALRKVRFILEAKGLTAEDLLVRDDREWMADHHTHQDER